MPLPDNVVAGELIDSAWGNAVADTVDAHETSINDNRTRAVTMHVAQFHHPAIEARVYQVTTDASGNATATFNQPFATIPQMVTVASADFGVNFVIIPYDSATTTTTFAVNASNAAGTTQPSVVIRFFAIAVGTWAP